MLCNRILLGNSLRVGGIVEFYNKFPRDFRFEASLKDSRFRGTTYRASASPSAFPTSESGLPIFAREKGVFARLAKICAPHVYYIRRFGSVDSFIEFMFVQENSAKCRLFDPLNNVLLEPLLPLLLGEAARDTVLDNALYIFNTTPAKLLRKWEMSNLR